VLFQLSQSIYSNNANIDPDTLQAPTASSSSSAAAAAAADSLVMSLPDGAVDNLTSVYDSVVYIGELVCFQVEVCTFSYRLVISRSGPTQPGQPTVYHRHHQAHALSWSVAVSARCFQCSRSWAHLQAELRP